MATPYGDPTADVRVGGLGPCHCQHMTWKPTSRLTQTHPSSEVNMHEVSGSGRYVCVCGRNAEYDVRHDALSDLSPAGACLKDHQLVCTSRLCDSDARRAVTMLIHNKWSSQIIQSIM